MSELHETASVSSIAELAQPTQPEQEAQQIKYDNFYTPRNHDFYSKFQYADLNPKERRIRLLRIHPPIPAHNSSAVVQCDFLDDISMEDMKGKYTTISYCAGDPKKTEVIVVNGFEFNAFANLGHALRQARHFWKDKFEEQELLLWADQVCIDQSNSLERAHQVEMMGEIYASAEQVLICLSAEGDPKGGIEWIYGILRDQSLNNKTIRVQEHSCDERSNDCPLESDQSILFSGRNEMDFHLGFDAFLKTILRSKWWSRVWVQQEFLRSRQALFIAAFEVIPWKVVAVFMNSYWMTVIHFKKSIPALHPGSARAFSNCLACDFGKYSPSFWIDVRRADELLKLKQNTVYNAGQFPDMLHHLKTAFVYKSSDPRDMIYARLGISDRYNGITPNYSPEISFQHVLTQWAIHVISEDNNLAIIEWGYLTRSFGRDPTVPSWVPDWRELSNHQAGHTYKHAVYHSVSKIPISFQPDLDGQKDRILQVQGCFYDVLQSQIRKWSGQATAAKKFITATGKQIPAIGKPKVGDQAWLLHGYSNLLVLRPNGECYELIGEVLGDDGILPEVPALVESLASLVDTNHPSVQIVKIC